MHYSCYVCGCLGHVLKDCSVSRGEGADLPFGSWLRASNGIGDRKSHSNMAKSPDKRGPIRASSQEDFDDFVDQMAVTLTNSKSIISPSPPGPSGTSNTLAPIINLQSSIKDNPEKELQGQSSRVDMVQEHDISEKLLSNPGNKMKWKRRARGEHDTKSSSFDPQVELISGKRSIQHQINHTGISKKITVDASPFCSLVL